MSRLIPAQIGNVGVNPQDMEAQQIIPAGLIIRNLSLRVSNWRATKSLSEFLIRHQIKAIAGIDTRALTRKLREQAVLKGCIS